MCNELLAFYFCHTDMRRIATSSEQPYALVGVRREE